MENNKILNIAVNYPHFNSVLSYFDHPNLSHFIGQIVDVPLGRRSEIGCILDIKRNDQANIVDTKNKKIKFKKINSEIDPNIFIPLKELALFKWMAQYYHYPLGKTIFDCLPKFFKNSNVVKFRRPLSLEGQDLPLKWDLNNIQQEIVNAVIPQLHGKFERNLIHGITGSGKTAIYLMIIRRLLVLNKSALFIVPEINLTPQFSKFFTNHIKGKVYIYHGALSARKRVAIWKEILNSEGPLLVIAARSGVFLPINNLGGIIIDEEHESSFKQEDRCPYHARDVATKKAQIYNIPIFYGSATPSLEVYHSIKLNQKGNYFALNKRVSGKELPQIEYVETKGTPYDAEIWPLHSKSIDQIKMAIDQQQQILVFINRLGHSRFVQCRSCAHSFECPNCSVHLKYFHSTNCLKCHFCHYTLSLPESCPKCSCLNLLHKGFGTERVHLVLQNLLKGVRIARFDRDELTTPNKIEERLNEFQDGIWDILVGTQMLSKGHHFPNVGLVVVLGIDAQLNFPDFRSLENAYQMLNQVTGRAGREKFKGQVVIQTLDKNHPLFEFVGMEDSQIFYNNELELRSCLKLPPFARLIVFYWIGKNKNSVQEFALQSEKILKQLIALHFNHISLGGTRAAVIEKRVGKYTWCSMLMGQDAIELHHMVLTFLKNIKVPPNIQMKVDVDPLRYM